MAGRTKPLSRSASWEEKYKALRKEFRRLRAALAQAQTERDAYQKSFHALTRKPFSFTEREIQEMRDHPGGIEDILEGLQKGNQ